MTSPLSPDLGLDLGFDFEAAVTAPFRMQPGLRKLAPGARHLTALPSGGRHQREKMAVLSAFADQALASAPGFDPQPALGAVARQAALEHPEAWHWDGLRAVAPLLGVAVVAGSGPHGWLDTRVERLSQGSFGLGDELPRCLEGLPPAWRLAGLLSLSFAEDLAVVDGRTAHIPWICAALPSHWAPQDKVGRHFAEVHAPVADSDRLRLAAAAITRMVCGPDRWERFVWNVSPGPRLHAHPARTDPRGWALISGPVASRAWWRTERQTFLPLPERGQAVFTIGVDVQPLALALAKPARARALHDAIASMSPAVLAYRHLGDIRDELLAWLAERAEGESPT